jgi:putative transposase
MKKKRFTEEQIIRILKESESGRKTPELCREYGISTATFYTWRKKFAGMQVNQLKRLKELEAENRRLKQLYADAMLDNTALKDVLSKKW